VVRLNASEVAAVFTSGKSVMTPPLRLIADRIEVLDLTEAAIKVAFAVPKKLVKKAICRNRIKRLMRVAYQNQENVTRGTFLTKPTACYRLVFMYTDKEERSLQDITHAIIANVNFFVQNI
jgi:ribonuclease P protein component